MKKCNIPIGEKIKQVREAKKWSQDALGFEIDYSRSTIYLVESGSQACSSGMLHDIRRVLGVEDLPLTEPERESFREKLNYLYKLIKSNELDEAKEELDKLSVITYLPLDKELNTLYNLFKARILFKQKDVDAAETILAGLDFSVIEHDNEAKYPYYISKGALCCKSGNYKDGLDYYLKVREVTQGGFEENQLIYYTIACCFHELGYASDCISFIEENCKPRPIKQATLTIFGLEYLLAKNYIRVERIKRAKKSLANCLEMAKSIGDELYIGSTFVDYAYLYRLCGDCMTALSYIRKAFHHLQEGTTPFLEAFYQKTRCYIEIESLATSKKLLAKGKELSQNNETYSILFECLGHLMTLKESESLQYLEEVAIPYFLKTNEKDALFDFCIILQKQYVMGKGSMRKQLYVERIISGIYKERMGGGVDYEE